MRWAIAAVLLTSGCAYHLKLETEPAGAQVLLPDGSVVTTPTETTLKWGPFSRQEVVASAPGYRTLTVDLRRTEVRFGKYIRDAIFRPSTLQGAPRGQVELVLIPEHDPAGTWTAPLTLAKARH